MSIVKLVSKEGSAVVVPKFKVETGSEELVMSSTNPNVNQFVAAHDGTEDTVVLRGVTLRKGVWVAKPKTREELMLEGVLIDGVMCSLTAEDQWGLRSVKDDVVAGMDVPYYFKNGNVYVLTQTNVAAFEAAWKPARAAFFPMPT